MHGCDGEAFAPIHQLIEPVEESPALCPILLDQDVSHFADYTSTLGYIPLRVGVICSEPERRREEMKRKASCSDVQQLAEQLMVREFSGQLGRELVKAKIPIGKAKVAVDGFHRDDHRVTLVEAWAHIGKAKSAQRNKVLSDMLKLALLT